MINKLAPLQDDYETLDIGTDRQAWVMRFHHFLIDEFFSRNAFCWIPIFMVIGAFVFFGWSSNPKISNGSLLAIFAGLITTLFLFRKSQVSFLVLLACTFALFGFSAAKLETDRKAASNPIEAGYYSVEGTISSIHKTGKRTRLTLSQITVESTQSSQNAKLIVSISEKSLGLLSLGDRIFLTAFLNKSSGPVLPGGFNFRRNDYFNNLQGRGYAIDSALPLIDPATGLIERNQTFQMQIDELRYSIWQTINRKLEGQSAAIAGALLVGDRSALNDTTEEALRASGLAHILAISGLHMALATSLIFFSSRLLLSILGNHIPKLPAKKIAASLAFFAAIFYLVLSGASVSTQRAFIMIAVALAAILLNRNAISLRNVAIAAIIVILMKPSNVMSPGFQMSFLAVLALISVFSKETTTRSNVAKGSNQFGLVRKTLIGGRTLIITAFVAGMATAPVAIFHFYQTATYGVLGNALAMPLVAFVIMPFGVLSMLAMPFGLDAWFLKGMSFGIDHVMEISKWVASLDGAVQVIGQTNAIVSGLMVLAILVMVLLHAWAKLLATPVIVLALCLHFFDTKGATKILISEDAKHVGIVDQYSNLHILSQRQNKFVANIWRRALNAKPIEGGSSVEIENCNKHYCVGHFSANSTPLIIGLAFSAEALFELCQMKVDIVVSPIIGVKKCGGGSVLISKAITAKTGAIRLMGPGQTGFGDEGSELSRNVKKLGLELQTSIPIDKRPWH